MDEIVFLGFTKTNNKPIYIKQKILDKLSSRQKWMLLNEIPYFFIDKILKEIELKLG